MENNKCLEGRNIEVIINKNKVDLWGCVDQDARDHLCHGEAAAGTSGAFSWPQRSYICSFCKREFRSAQALGGHMNVHRRDRARLRQSPPRDGHGHFSFLNLNLDPNPSLNFNTNPSFSSPSSKCPPPPPPSFPSRLPPLFVPPISTLSSTPPASTIPEMRAWDKESVSQMYHLTQKASEFGNIRATKRLLELEKSGTNVPQKDGNVMKKAEIVRLELKIGLLGQEHEDLDLELRLGYA